MTETSVLTRVVDGVGHVTLNRPQALNALTLDMIRLITAALEAWRDDPAVTAVRIDGAGDRGLCAGGDVRALYDQIVAGSPEEAGAFFREEYALNALIAEYPRPVTAVADGITMGGGIGLAGHASDRIVTERSRLAMPETRIGFTPDVGGSWLLAHAPGRLGEYLALTGTTMDAADALLCGFADRFVPVDGQASAGESKLAAARPWIDDAFAAADVRGILERLRARPEPEAADTAATLETLSPTGLAVTLAAVRRARTLPDLRAALAQEYGLVMWFATTQPDLVEGIRAQLVDKDRNPRWNPATIGDLAPDVADRALAYVP